MEKDKVMEEHFIPFKYLIIHEDFSVVGLNDETKAREASEFVIVIDVVEGLVLGNSKHIEEARTED